MFHSQGHDDIRNSSNVNCVCIEKTKTFIKVMMTSETHPMSIVFILKMHSFIKGNALVVVADIVRDDSRHVARLEREANKLGVEISQIMAGK